MVPQFFLDKRPHQGLRYDEYLHRMEALASIDDPGSLPETERKYWEYTRLNYQRTRRIHKTYQISDELKSLLKNISGPQLWMVLTEPWCGDSAQNLPYIAEMARVNPNINLRILSRDHNPDIMDQYLTGGKRSIPILVAFDARGRELFTWGPRPAPAAEVFRKAARQGLEKPELNQKLHLWYGRDRGKTLEREFTELLKRELALAG